MERSSSSGAKEVDGSLGVRGLEERRGREEGQRCVRRRSMGFGGGGGREEFGAEAGGVRDEVREESSAEVMGEPESEDGEVPERVAMRRPEARVSTPALAVLYKSVTSVTVLSSETQLDRVKRGCTHGGS